MGNTKHSTEPVPGFLQLTSLSMGKNNGISYSK